MADFKFECPHCRQHLEAGSEMTGMELDCPTCQGRFTVPEAPAVPADVKPPLLPLPPFDYTPIVLATLTAQGQQSDLYLRDKIPKHKETNARQACALSPETPLLALIDCTVLGSAKNCVLFTPHGLHVHNGPGSGTAGPITIPYTEFHTRQFAKAPGIKQIALGNNQILDAAGCSVPPPVLINILQQIRTEITGEPPANQSVPPQNGAAQPTGLRCPRCQGTRIEEETCQKGGTVGSIAGGLLFGVVGSIIGGAMTIKNVVRYRCLACRHQWDKSSA